MQLYNFKRLFEKNILLLFCLILVLFPISPVLADEVREPPRPGLDKVDENDHVRPGWESINGGNPLGHPDRQLDWDEIKRGGDGPSIGGGDGPSVGGGDGPGTGGGDGPGTGGGDGPGIGGGNGPGIGGGNGPGIGGGNGPGIGGGDGPGTGSGNGPGYPYLGSNYPGFGPGYPGLGSNYPGFGPGYPYLGSNYPGFGSGYPYLGSNYPGFGPGYPTLGGNYLGFSSESLGASGGVAGLYNQLFQFPVQVTFYGHMTQYMIWHMVGHGFDSLATEYYGESGADVGGIPDKVSSTVTSIIGNSINMASFVEVDHLNLDKGVKLGKTALSLPLAAIAPWMGSNYNMTLDAIDLTTDAIGAGFEWSKWLKESRTVNIGTSLLSKGTDLANGLWQTVKSGTLVTDATSKLSGLWKAASPFTKGTGILGGISAISNTFESIHHFRSGNALDGWGSGIGALGDTLAAVSLFTGPAAPFVATAGLLLMGVSAGIRYRDKLAQAWNATKNFASNVWNGTKDIASNVWNGTKDIASNVWNGTKDIASNVWNGTKDIASNVWNGTKDVASNVWNGTKDVASNVWNGTKDVASNVWNGTKDVASNVWDGTKDIAGNAWNATTDAVDNVGKGISNGFKSIGKGIGNLFGGS